MVFACHLGRVTRKHQSAHGQSGRTGFLPPAPTLFLVVPSQSARKGSQWPHTHCVVKDDPELLRFSYLCLLSAGMPGYTMSDLCDAGNGPYSLVRAEPVLY